jgi:phage tail sheath protein FI
MPEYLSPGVYVEEIDRGPKPIEGVGTAMAAFVGFTEKAEYAREVAGELVVENLLNRPQLLTNWSQFVERFGNFVPGIALPQSVYGYFMNGGSRCYVVSIRTFPKAESVLLNSQGKPAIAVRARQAGVDGMKLRVRVAAPPALPAPAAPAGKKDKAAAAGGENPDQPAPAPEAEGPAAPQGFSFNVEKEFAPGSWKTLESFSDVRLQTVLVDEKKQVMLAFKNNKQPKYVELTVVEPAALEKAMPREQEQALMIDKKLLESPTASDFRGDVSERKGVEGLEVLDDVTMLCVPDLMTTLPGEKLNIDMVKAVQMMMIAHCERMGDRVAILDAPPDLTPQEVKKWRMDIAGFDTSYAAMYYPWIKIMDPATDTTIKMPPSGFLAGLWARSDNTRGVHKAPANEVLLGAIGLAYQTTKGEQDTLNPIGVNCIRAFPGRGIRVWGARTLSSNPSWRYINVRRLFNYVEKSIENGTQWVVFEPNNRKLWARVNRDVSSFLRMVWRDGALFGSSPEEAFYVKCDDELNPPESRDLGRLIIEIGMAPVKPAEFVIFRISQWAGPGSE